MELNKKCVEKKFKNFPFYQQENIDLILKECEAHNFLPAQIAYVLATTWHETAFRMAPVRETLASSDEEAAMRLERAWAQGRLPQVKRPYWRKDEQGRYWFGRGYVQITHKENYNKFAKELGQPLDLYPNLALNPTIAAKILVIGMHKGLFTGHKISDFINDKKIDFVNARKVVNGLDQAHKIASYAQDFLYCFSI